MKTTIPSAALVLTLLLVCLEAMAYDSAVPSACTSAVANANIIVIMFGPSLSILCEPEGPFSAALASVDSCLIQNGISTGRDTILPTNLQSATALCKSGTEAVDTSELEQLYKTSACCGTDTGIKYLANCTTVATNSRICAIFLPPVTQTITVEPSNQNSATTKFPPQTAQPSAVAAGEQLRKRNVGMIVGAVVGSFCGLLIVGGTLGFVILHRRKNYRKVTETPGKAELHSHHIKPSRVELSGGFLRLVRAVGGLQEMQSVSSSGELPANEPAGSEIWTAVNTRTTS